MVGIMSKKLKRTLFVVIVVIMLLFLTGCGSEKLIATKSFLKEDIGFNAVETVEMSVEDQEVKETTVILEFDDVKMSEDFVTFFKDDLKDNVEYKREEKKVTLQNDDFICGDLFIYLFSLSTHETFRY